ncbi:MAG: hypothetical protein V1799_01465 [bacterium]
MYFDLTSFKQVDDYRLFVSFENGKSGIINLGDFIPLGGMFSRLIVWNIVNRFSSTKNSACLRGPMASISHLKLFTVPQPVNLYPIG